MAYLHNTTCTDLLCCDMHYCPSLIVLVFCRSHINQLLHQMLIISTKRAIFYNTLSVPVSCLCIAQWMAHIPSISASDGSGDVCGKEQLVFYSVTYQLHSPLELWPDLVWHGRLPTSKVSSLSYLECLHLILLPVTINIITAYQLYDV